MHKEQITDKEAICILISFILGSSLIMGVDGQAKNDAWIAGIVGMIMAIPMILVYIRIISFFPGKDLFEILNLVLGKVVGTIIGIVYIWYAFHLGALIIRNLGEFVNTLTMPETPIFVPMLCMGLVAIFVVKSGIEVIGRTSAYILPLVIFIILLIQVFAIPYFHFNYIKPILGNGLAPILQGGFSAFSFPFAETVLFMGAFFSLKTKQSPFKVYFTGIFFAGVVIIFLTLRNILILGEMFTNVYFPSHIAVSRINVGTFFQRIEVAVAIVFVFCAFIKSSICLLVACRGISRIFNLHDYRSIVIQVGLLMTYFAYTVYDNIIMMKYWSLKIYAYYAFPFQVIIPIMLWIVIEVRKKKLQAKKTS